MEFLLAIGVAMFAGLFLSRLTSRFNLPDVTSYLVAGLLIGPLCLGRLGVPGLGFTSFDFVDAMGLISDVALGFIAFSIGSEFRVSALRKIGRQATVIAIFQALAATALVDVALLLLHLFLGDRRPVSTCIILGAIATATAPAARAPVTSSLSWMSPPAMMGLRTVAVSWRITLGITPGSTSMRSQLSCSRERCRLSTAMESSRKKRWREISPRALARFASWGRVVMTPSARVWRAM